MKTVAFFAAYALTFSEVNSFSVLQHDIIRPSSCSALFSSKTPRKGGKRQGFHPTNTNRRIKHTDIRNIDEHVEPKNVEDDHTHLDHFPLPRRSGLKLINSHTHLDHHNTHIEQSLNITQRFLPGYSFTHKRFHQQPDNHQQNQDGHQNRNPVEAFLNKIIPSDPNSKLVSRKPAWKKLQKEAEYIETTHLRDLLKEKERCDAMYAEHDGVYLDYSRQRATLDTLKYLIDLAESQDLLGKMNAMKNGEKINFTEDRAVLHTALRTDKSEIGKIIVDDVDVVKEVHEVLDSIEKFTTAIRSGEIRGHTGKRIRNIVSVGIGGSYLGPEFLHEVLKTEPEGINAALGYSLRFLSNVDPVDVERTCADLDPEETLIVIVSKTFTTAETMLNARTMRQWLWDFMGDDKEVVRKHVVACASISAMDKVAAFGINTDEYFFRFWDWVGGRYSVCSAAGAVPISLLYGYDLFEKFLLVSLKALYST